MNDEYLKSFNSNIFNHVFHHNKINDKIDVYSIGCENSQWDVEKIAHMLNTDELNENIVIFNTCAVTELAQNISENIAEKLYNIHSDKKLFYTGCGVSYNQRYYNKYGTAILEKDKFNILNYGYIKKNNGYNFETSIYKDYSTVIKIQDGCYHNCSYCVIHKLRTHYTVPYSKIKYQISEYIKQGNKCFTLFGTDICSYNYDGMCLTDLCKKLLEEIPEIECIILDNIDPASKELDKLIEYIKVEPKIYNHLPLSVQSCSDTILKAMNRRHDSNRIRELNKLCEDKVFLEFEIIVGFPGETDELFQETLNLIRELKIKNVATYIFSRREGTIAYDLPNQIPLKVKEKRQRILHDEIKKINNFVFDVDHVSEFFKHRPDNLHNCLVKYCDLYNTEEFYKLFNELKTYDEKKEIVLITEFNDDKDIYNLASNVKLLVLNFGVKVIMNMKVCDNLLKNIINNDKYKKLSFLDFSYKVGVYLDFVFDKLETSSEDEVLELFKQLQSSNLYNMESMIHKLIKSGNKKYLKYIINELNITI